MRRKSLIVVIDKKSGKTNPDVNFANAEPNVDGLLPTSENNSDDRPNNKIMKPIVSADIRTGRSSSGSRTRSGTQSGSSSSSGSTSRSESSSESNSRRHSSSGKKPIVGQGYRSGKSKSGSSSSGSKSKSKSESSPRYKTGSLYRPEKKPIVGTKLRSAKSSSKTSGKQKPNIISQISSKLGFRSRKKVSSAWVLASTLLIVVITIQLAFIADTMNKYRSTFTEYDTITSEIKALNDTLTVKKGVYIDNYISNLLNKTLSTTDLATIAKRYWKYEIKINGSIVTDSFVEYVPNGLKIELFERENERVFPAKIHLSGALSGGKADVLSSHISFVPDDGFTIKNEKYNETDAITGEKYKVNKVTYTFTSTSVRNEDRVEIKVGPELAQRLKAID